MVTNKQHNFVYCNDVVNRRSTLLLNNMNISVSSHFFGGDVGLSLA